MSDTGSRSRLPPELVFECMLAARPTEHEPPLKVDRTREWYDDLLSFSLVNVACLHWARPMLFEYVQVTGAQRVRQLQAALRSSPRLVIYVKHLRFTHCWSRSQASTSIGEAIESIVESCFHTRSLKIVGEEGRPKIAFNFDGLVSQRLEALWLQNCRIYRHGSSGATRTYHFLTSLHLAQCGAATSPEGPLQLPPPSSFPHLAMLTCLRTSVVDAPQFIKVVGPQWEAAFMDSSFLTPLWPLFETENYLSHFSSVTELTLNTPLAQARDFLVHLPSAHLLISLMILLYPTNPQDPPTLGLIAALASCFEDEDHCTNLKAVSMGDPDRQLSAPWCNHADGAHQWGIHISQSTGMPEYHLACPSNSEVLKKVCEKRGIMYEITTIES